MSKPIKADICVIGAGSGGLSVAAGASQMGAKTVLIERGAMGGDCLNTGCVPSKALLAAGHHAQAARDGVHFGVTTGEPKIDFDRAISHVHEVIAGIAPHDSVERFEGLGVTVLQAEARFADEKRVIAGGQEVKARRFVIATGSRAAVPPISGLDEVAYFTNETIFENRTCPNHLIIVGGGPIGLEMAQAHRRLGAKVTVLEAAKALVRDEPELAAIVLERLRGEGIDIREGVAIDKVSKDGDGLRLEVSSPAGSETLAGSHLLIATGRKPNVEALDLEAAGVEASDKGIRVDERLRTTNKKIFAIGDVTGGAQFTHVANYHAGLVIRNALFRMPAKADYAALPWATYTDPELAHVGLTEADATARGLKPEVLTWPFQENDRARAERRTEGLAKVVLAKGGKILGASIVGPHAGDLILPWGIAIQQGQKIGTFANSIVAYPTLSEVSKRAAGSYYTPTLYSRKTKGLVKLLSWFG